jgi:hypothetical protein
VRRPDSLATIQRVMAGAVMRPLGPGDTTHRENSATAKRIIKPNDRLTALERLQLYNQQYWWRLLGSFADDFPGLRAVLGERRFQRLAVAYLDTCGSTSWNLRDLGQHLASFLDRRSALTAPYTVLAREVARVEWAQVVAFDGPEKPRLDPQRIARTDPTKLRLGVQPYVTVLELRHPIDDLLRRRKRAETATASNAAAAPTTQRRRRLTAEPLRTPIHLAVHRVDLSVYFKRLEPEAARLLTALRDGEPLATACETAFADSPPRLDAAEKVQTWFATWMRLGWLCRA